MARFAGGRVRRDLGYCPKEDGMRRAWIGILAAGLCAAVASSSAGARAQTRDGEGFKLDAGPADARASLGRRAVDDLATGDGGHITIHHLNFCRNEADRLLVRADVPLVKPSDHLLLWRVERLADRATVLNGEFRLSKLTRLEGLVHGDRSGTASLRLAAARSTGGRLLLTLALRGTLVVTCQRCLEPLEWRVDESSEWLVVDSDAQAACVDLEASPLVLDAGRLGIETLLEDELIVALPMAPRHESIDDCGPLAQNLGAVPTDAARDEGVGSRDG